MRKGASLPQHSSWNCFSWQKLAAGMRMRKGASLPQHSSCNYFSWKKLAAGMRMRKLPATTQHLHPFFIYRGSDMLIPSS